MKMKEFCGENFKDCILEYRDNTNIWYLDSSEWSRLDKKLFDRMIEDLEFASQINSISRKYCLPCFKYLDSLVAVDWTGLSDEVLWRKYEEFMKIYVPAHASGHPANVLEMKNQRLSRFLKTYLLNRKMGTDVTEGADELFGILTEPVEDMTAQKEAKSFYELALFFRSEGAVSIDDESVLREKFPKVWEKLIKHHTHFCWTTYNWEGPANTISNYFETVISSLRQDINLEEEIQKIADRGESLKKMQEHFMERLQIDEKHKILLTVASDIMFEKALRKDCMYKAAWVTEEMYEEIGRRLDLSIHEARYVFFFEMREAILNKRINKEEIRERTKEVVLHQAEGNKDRIFVGKVALDFVDSLGVALPDKNIKEIKGQVAYPGKVKGIVKYVNTPEMMKKMNDGDILIAYATQPNLLPAMRKAAAFVTDFGGITCHAAIVAREWKIPCIIGTKNATKILKDGDLVEVDAEKGVVRKL